MSHLPRTRAGALTTLRELAAYHEAGHAVAALATGCELGAMTVGPHGGGLTRFRPPRDVPAARSRRDAVLRHLAGAAGEAVVVGLGSLSFAEVDARCGGAATDFAAARRACGPGGELSFLTWRWPRTVDLLVRRWTAVEALASVLRTEGAIEGSRASAIVERAR
ncbi:M50 family metallopeptidase [Anaeromyxobacter soli]|uniref:M50 family metallopeptidase n=1 Tax=Anaeromyxobacter soli TaxID=2922725 RepID=UPI0038CBFD51